MNSSTDLQEYQNRLKEALAALKKMRVHVEALEGASRDPIAVIGIGCRYPGNVNSPETFWNLLHDGVDAISEVPSDRWNIDAYYDPNRGTPGKLYTRYGGFIEGVGDFDPHFFGISPREARSMDPQQRLLLEVAWEALENAGYSPESLAESQTGVFVGVTMSDYLQLQSNLNAPERIGAYRITGNMFNSIAGRVSYTLGLHGPAMAVDTACSSSLVAIYLAVQSLLTNDSTLALAGGVNLLLSPEVSLSACQSNMLAPDGRCKTFDAQADGFIRSDGCGIVVLKRLSNAIADQDPILAIIRGAAVNSDGFTSGFTVPSKLAQEAVIRAALLKASVLPEQVGYVETHGTGTPLGDPIEVRALASVYGTKRTGIPALQIGSVKTNFGHTEAAAGVAGLIKTVLALDHGEIPPHLHLHELNPNFAWSDAPIQIPTRPTPWVSIDGRRLAGVSSFGASGVNAHLILEAAPSVDQTASAQEHHSQIMSLSAKTRPALRHLAEATLSYLGKHPDVPLEDICFTANHGRSHFNHRLALIGDSKAGFQESLRAFLDVKESENVEADSVHLESPQVAFLFTGHGSQYTGMGRSLYATSPVFRQTFTEVERLLKPYLEESISSVVFSAPETESPFFEGMKYTQPALFALEYSLAQLWRSWGIEPAAVLGHSVGEYAAACIAGVMSLADAVQLVAARGRLMDELPEAGTMAVVFAEEGRISPVLERVADKVSIAVINSPENVVISGASEAVQSVLDELAGAGIRSRILDIAQASHSPMIEPILDAFGETAERVVYAEPRIDYISCLTGDLVKGREASQASYWQHHLRQTVRFAKSIKRLAELGYQHFIEIGPHPTLLGIGKHCLPNNSGAWLPSLRKDRPDWDMMLTSLGYLYDHGAIINWKGFYQGQPRGHASLPTYPFQHKRYWVRPGPSSKVAIAAGEQIHPLLGTRVSSASTDWIFEGCLSLQEQPFLVDHRVGGEAVLPATAFLEMALASGRVILGETPILEEVIFQEYLSIPSETCHTLQVVGSPDKDGQVILRICSQDEETGQWIQHMQGRACPAAASEIPQESLSVIQARCPESQAIPLFYQKLKDRGLEFGPSFQGLVGLWIGKGEALGQVQIPVSMEKEVPNFYFHPALWDACLQPIGALLPEDGQPYLPFILGQLKIYSQLRGNVWSHITIRQEGGRSSKTVSADVRLFGEDGRLAAEMNGLALRQSRGGDGDGDALKDRLYEVSWQLLPDSLVQSPASTGDWLIFVDNQGIGIEFSRGLVEMGNKCVTVRRGEAFQANGPDDYILDPTRSEDFLRLLNEAGKRSYLGVLYCWPLDIPFSALESSSQEGLQEIFCGGGLHLAQALVKHGVALRQGFSLVTRRAIHVQGVREGIQFFPAGATLWGLGKVIAQEHPELHCRCLDLDLAEGEEVKHALLAAISSDSEEDQIAIRNGQYFVSRLVRSTIAEKRKTISLAEGGPYELVNRASGTLDQLVFQPITRRSPGFAQVEIEVYATGLGFRDVLLALDMYPGDEAALGSECAGRITAVGPSVQGWQVGDRVLAVASGSFASHVIVPDGFLARQPDGMTDAEAAGIPSAFLTAYYALNRLGKMKSGDRVLIHAAAGGVGMAAVQLGLRAGAEIFATAGSPAKRSLLREMGAQHVMDSRSLNFADEILEISHGRGVDLVLNSLSGAFIEKSVQSLAENGCFLEIGKRSIWSPAQFREVKPDASYIPFDLLEEARKDASLISSLFQELMPAFKTGSLTPLPVRQFTLAEVIPAFRYMEAAKHTGKIVLMHPKSPQTVFVRPNATYLITGGLGGLGRGVAGWLVERGARHLILAGRSSPSPAAQEFIQQLEKQDVEIQVVQIDVSVAADVAQLIAEISASSRQLRGVFHAAGVLDDGALVQQNWVRFAQVFKPKVAGGWNLHQSTQGLQLDFFVLFSSAVFLLGSPGQGNHVAASAYLDSLAAYRRALGLPALSIDWGPWSGIGAASSVEVSERLEARGILSMTAEQGLADMEAVMMQTFPAEDSTPASVGVMSVIWPQFVRQFANHHAPPFYSELANELTYGKFSPEAGKEFPATQPDFHDRLVQAPASKRTNLMLGHVRDQIIKSSRLGFILPSKPPSTSTRAGAGFIDGCRVAQSAGHRAAVRAAPTGHLGIRLYNC